MNQYNILSKERKELQKKGELPEWLATAGYQLLKEKAYLDEDESLTERWKNIAETAGNHLPEKYRKEYTKRFYDLMYNQILSPSTPVLANMGKTNKGCPVSCSGSYVGDSVYNFYTTNREIALLSKYGFGTSACFTDVRPRGSIIKSGGQASGVVPVMDEYYNTASNISQGSNRRGSIACYLNVEHDDFYEVVNYIENNPNGRNLGWLVSDSFIKRLDEGDAEALLRYKEILALRMIGKGYIFFIDRANRANPSVYKKYGWSVKASNLCVAPDTFILTDKGQIEIQTVVNQTVNVWNGEEFSEVVVKKTSKNTELTKVTLSDGSELTCTPEHKWYITNNYDKPSVECSTQDLKIGDTLIKYQLPVIKGTHTLHKAYTNGFYSGDDCRFRHKGSLYLYAEKKFLENVLECDGSRYENEIRVIFTNTSGLKNKFFVPNNDYTINSRLEWLAGLIDADGVIVRDGFNESIQISSTNKKFLSKIRLMLQTLGMYSKIDLAREAYVYELPINDGTNVTNIYECLEIYRLLINPNEVYKLHALGLITHHLRITPRLPQKNDEHFVYIKHIEENVEINDTYCFTEPKRHMGMFNGILTGQCSEISLHSDNEHTYTCVLSSLNVLKYNDWDKYNAIHYATVFLDCVASEFIKLGKNIPGLERAVRFTEKSKALGLGVMGFGSYLQANMIPFDSMDAHFFNIELFKKMKLESKKTSVWLAKELGEPELMKGTGFANSHLCAVAPTISTSLIMGGVSNGIEPFFGNVYTQDTAGGEIRRANEIFVQLLKSKKKWTKDVINSIIQQDGSVQHLDFLSIEEKEVFKTAFEVDQRTIISLADYRQQYIDQAQSVNLFIASNVTEEYINEVHKLAFKAKYLKSLYYIRSSSKIKIDNESCVMCEG